MFRFQGDAAARLNIFTTTQVARVEQRGDSTVVAMTGTCVQIQAEVNEHALRPLPETGVGSGYGSSCGGFVPDDFVAPAATKVYWPDGRIAGRVGSQRMVFHRYASEQEGARRCFKRHPTDGSTCGSEGKYLSVCFDDRDLGSVADLNRARRAP